MVRMTADVVQEVVNYAARALNDTWEKVTLDKTFWQRALDSAYTQYEGWVKHSPPEFIVDVSRWSLDIKFKNREGEEEEKNEIYHGSKRKFVAGARSYYGSDYGCDLKVTDPALIAEYEEYAHTRDLAYDQLQKFRSRLTAQLQQFGTLNTALRQVPELWNVLPQTLKDRYNEKSERTPRAAKAEPKIDEDLTRHLNMAATLNVVLDSSKNNGGS
jgi:hypothetical protein